MPRHFFLIFFICAFLISACSTNTIPIESKETTLPTTKTDKDKEPKNIAKPTKTKPTSRLVGKINPAQGQFHVGVFLPLSGPDKLMGEDLQMATLIALKSAKLNNLRLKYYDTEGNAEKAAEVAKQAVKDGIQLVIGPIRNSSVRAIKDILADRIMIAFSNDKSSLSANTPHYLLGLDSLQQIKAIIAAAQQNPRQRYSLITMPNSYGDLIETAFINTIQSLGHEISGIYRLQNNEHNLIAKIATNYDERREALLKLRKELQDKQEEGTEKALERLNNIDSLGAPPYDAIVLALDNPLSIRELSAQLAFYDDNNKPILGTALWSEFPQLALESSLQGAIYPSLRQNHLINFIDRFNSIYNRKPHPFAAMAYEAIGLMALIVSNPNNPEEKLTDPSGFMSINGLFRMRRGTTAQRALSIYKISNNKLVNIAPAHTSFEDY